MARIEIATDAGLAWADLDRPRAARCLLVLTHGAGAGVETADLLAVRDAAVAAGIAVALITQPFRVAGRRTPPAPKPQDRAWLQVVDALRRRRGLAALPLIVGGRSNGARVACRTAADTAAKAVVALAFPLHPPGKPEKSRLDELAAVNVPVLVVQGDRDAFGMPPAGVGRQVVVIPGADHSLKRDPTAGPRSPTRSSNPSDDFYNESTAQDTRSHRDPSARIWMLRGMAVARVADAPDTGRR
jgi:predicted alpha/beta-hydrolase family hydrolase